LGDSARAFPDCGEVRVVLERDVDRDPFTQDGDQIGLRPPWNPRRLPDAAVIRRDGAGGADGDGEDARGLDRRLVEQSLDCIGRDGQSPWRAERGRDATADGRDRVTAEVRDARRDRVRSDVDAEDVAGAAVEAVAPSGSAEAAAGYALWVVGAAPPL